MSGERDYKDYLEDILKAIEDIDNFTKDMNLESIAKDKGKLYAIAYCLQIIGEAVKNIPENIKENYREIPWRDITGMRDRLVHGYFAIKPERVWETVKEDLSPLKEIVIKILKEK